MPLMSKSALMGRATPMQNRARAAAQRPTAKMDATSLAAFAMLMQTWARSSNRSEPGGGSCTIGKDSTIRKYKRAHARGILRGYPERPHRHASATR